ncbi:methyl-accepting chemotaxis protein, partial [Blastomonas sp. AAP53]|uniref:methyl-accepting chemotaxis protein n=1 Tax=Blastomonas sp. AAP53 TaxID=1248760 RepID=UPI000368453E
MIKDFYAHYPIRKKFDLILVVLLALTAIPVVIGMVNLMNDTGGSVAQVVTKLGVMAAVTAFMLYAKKAICDPYVSTVVRMEGLAAGDLASPILYQDHKDCVGRMSRSMLVFKDNATERVRSDAVLHAVVSELTTGLQHMKNGNLTYSIDAAFDAEYDSLRRDFNATLTQFCELLSQTSTVANHVLTGASEIRSASGDLAQRTEQQAASLEESAAAMREVTSMVQQTAQNASEVGKQVEEAHTAATTGGDVVRRAVGAMDAIQKSSGQITNIIDVIDGIAFQTNLLALNAGVEAARAG